MYLYLDYIYAIIGNKEGVEMSKYRKGRIVTGVVTGVEKYGIFVGLDEFYSGLIHISEVSNGFVKDVHLFVDVGETIRAKVISVDDESCHVKLSIKDIDYRPENHKRQQIIETEKGFQPLAEHLNIWIDEKMREIKEI